MKMNMKSDIITSWKPQKNSWHLQYGSNVHNTTTEKVVWCGDNGDR